MSLGSAGDGHYLGRSLPLAYGRVFGGQILAQVIAACAEQLPDKVVKSLAIHFSREADPLEQLDYGVIVNHEGRTFASLHVAVSQGSRVMASALVTCHVPDESGLTRQEVFVDGGEPEDARATDLGMIPWDTRIVGGVDLGDPTVGPAELQIWMRAPDLVGEPVVHQGLLAYATDLTLIGTALRPVEGLSQADSRKRFHSAVTAHYLWFHRPVDLGEWCLLDQSSPVTAGGRVFGRGDVYRRNGDLLASFAQEAMVRAISQRDVPVGSAERAPNTGASVPSSQPRGDLSPGSGRTE